tara:strand:+ start:1275 stop:1793 length:519 start_codon:yes stop_codon:yes gene_type:complete
MSGNLYKKDHGQGTIGGYAHGFNEPGLRNVGSYQVSGHPFITGSTFSAANKVHLIQFPYVSKSLTVINTTTAGDGDIRVHFQSGSGVTAVTSTGLTGEQGITDDADVISGYHFITVPDGQGSVTLEVKCKQFYISNSTGSCTYQVLAELTNISTSRMYHLTGSGITDSHEPT